MPVAPTPSEIYRRAVVEGERRLSASRLELVSSGFNAGLTIVFGIAAFAVVDAVVRPLMGPEAGRLIGAGAFGMGMVFLVVSRSELFSENFFDPLAAVRERSDMGIQHLARLWSVVLVLNLVGGAVLALTLSVHGVLPPGAHESLRAVAEELGAKTALATFANAVVGGALVTLLSFLLEAVDRVLARMVVAYLVGFLLAAAPFAHAVVTAQHLLLGVVLGAPIGLATAALVVAIAVAGNTIGGVALVTLTHIAQARASED